MSFLENGINFIINSLKLGKCRLHFQNVDDMNFIYSFIRLKWVKLNPTKLRGLKKWARLFLGFLENNKILDEFYAH